MKHDWKDSVVYIEDDPAHAEILTRAASRAGIKQHIHHYLDGPSFFEDAENAEGCPTLILLDLRLPTMDGILVMQQIRSMEKFSEIPVAILSSSDSESDRSISLGNGAEAYYTKPAGFDKMCELLSTINDNWLV